MLINVLGHHWEIVEVPKVDDDSVGLCDRDAMRVTIDQSLNDARRWAIL